MKLPIGKEAVVIGAGIAGLCVARTLADFFEKVTVLDRDERPEDARPRPGVPQGRHPHVLMCGGLMALSDLLPGFERDLRAAGAAPLCCGRDMRWEIPDIGVLPKRDLGLSTFAMTRPLLEQVLYRRISGRANVEFRHGARAAAILVSRDGATATGVRCVRADGEVLELAADLVVDASGQAAPTLACLQATGRGAPTRTAIGVDLGYSTGVFSIPSSVELGFGALITLPRAPESSRTGYMLRIGPTSWQVLLVGRGDDRPPGDLASFLAYASTLASPTIANALQGAFAHSEIVRFGFRESVWRRFEQPGLLPRRLLPIGDAMCRLNPVYGHGMSVAAQEAMLLDRVLWEHSRRGLSVEAAVANFLACAADLIAVPWALSTIPDFVYPQTRGERPPNLEDELRSQAEAFRRAMHDPVIHRQLVGTLHLVKAGLTAGTGYPA
ncbi:FAD-dependent oxidoreductase [Arenibaculum pallidiluteum]|uniref:FAD-dependent oxidoreductase n=1 Tax=Arenibaculum pallidiluteum TaxID=2812559 RepID=UPI001A957C15|nr:FAD-dependent monooxygenase [Arenibaculum pallidiluteum]